MGNDYFTIGIFDEMAIYLVSDSVGLHELKKMRETNMDSHQASAHWAADKSVRRSRKLKFATAYLR